MRYRLSKTFLYAFTLTLGMCTGFVAVAWTGPSGTAPNNNVGAPLNVSSTAQSKAGGLVINSGGAANGLITYGNTGIGTANPRAALEINGNLLTTAGYTANVNLASYNIGASTIGVQTLYGYTALCTGNASGACNSSGGVVLGAANTSAAVNIPNSGTAIFNGGGGVAIATTNPYGGVSLDVMPTSVGTWTAMINYNASGNAPGANYGLYSSGAVYAVYGNGPIYASAFYYSSDERLKKNIQTIASSTALQQVLALNPVTFNWIAKDKPQGTQIGFIAQQVEKIVPELILTDPKTGLKAVDYARVVPLLTGAIQEQQAHIEVQDAKINTQQSEIDQLKAEVELLKTK